MKKSQATIEKLEKTTKALKSAFAKEKKAIRKTKAKVNPSSRRTRITLADKIYFEYQQHIAQDINYPLKNMKFISSEIPLEFIDSLNRDVIASHGNKLAKSMRFMGNIRPVVITKMKYKSNSYRFYIIDGQHAYTALKSLGVAEIPVVEVPVKSLDSLVETIALLNSSSKSWSLKDYVIAWSNIHEDYNVLNNLYEKYDMELSIIAAIATGNTVANSTPGTSLIKSGRFRILNVDQTEQKLSDINEILNELPRMDRAANRYFILSLLNVFNEITYGRKHHKQLLKYVQENRETLKFALNNVNELKEYLLRAFN